jgi:signal transduction histidine kinase
MVKGAADKVLAIVRNITAEKKAAEQLRVQQEKLVQADKLVALGTLVAGIAHEINNPNNAIMVTTETQAATWSGLVPLLDEYNRDNGDFTVGGYPYGELREEIPKSFSRVLKNSNRIKQIVADLKNFARDDSGLIFEKVDLNEVVGSALRIIEKSVLKATDNLSLSLEPDLPAVSGLVHRLEQVVVNLVLNAAQALPSPDKGIRIGTRHDRDGGRIILEVKDEGIGIRKENMQKIFDPFFTTKRSAGGTGLGLFITLKIVLEHGGELTFASEPGEGTLARVVLPLVFDPVRTVAAAADGRG